MKKRIATLLMLALVSAGYIGVTGCVIAPPRGYHAGYYDHGHGHGYRHDRDHRGHDHDHWH
ncbi:MAG TPA: hypothetical protein VFJ04_00180 [Rhodanobacteraceae bacterium]|jgi:hypothetical protein|nr:hypothetical protein [Rhodanobacteraceae bacterium]